MSKPASQKIFTGNEDKEIVETKKKFISVIIKNGEEFKDVLAMAESVSKLGPACIEFLSNYFDMCTLFESEKMVSFKPSPAYRAFPTNHFLYEIFLQNTASRPDLRPKEVPAAVKQGLYSFYGSYLAPDASVANPYLHINICRKISLDLVKMHTTNEASVDIFDDAALIAIETLFWIGYPRYLNYKGGQTDKISKYQREWEQSLGISYSIFGIKAAESEVTKSRGSIASKDSENCNSNNGEFTSEISKSSSLESFSKGVLGGMKKETSKAKSGFLAGIFGGVQKECTKEAMVETLQNSKQYKKFEKFVKVLSIFNSKGQHCDENLLCFQYFLKLEARTRKTFKGELEPCLARFLDTSTDKIDRVSEGNKKALETMVPLFLFFYGMFICQGAENEVNIPSKLRNEIEAKVKDISIVMIPMDIFDHAVDHVLELLYLNSFTKFVKK